MTGELHGEVGGGDTEQFWERHYQARERIWSGRANPVLVAVVGGLPPGSALDLGCGEGGDAVWLAERGWTVTAVDVSATALGRASARAAEAGVEDRIDFQQHDLARSLPVGAFDLVSAQYLLSPIEFPRDRILHEVAGTVAPGGLLLIVDHASAPPWAGSQHPHPRFRTPEETLVAIDLNPEDWDTELLGSSERQATGPEGQSATLTDRVIALRRLSP